MRILRHVVLLLAALAFAVLPARASLAHDHARTSHASYAHAWRHIARATASHRADAPKPCRGHHVDCGGACCGVGGLSPLVGESIALDRRTIAAAPAAFFGDDPWRDGALPGLPLRPPKTA